jgi:hypothetical protein
MSRFIVDEPIAERTVWQYRATLVREDRTPVQPAELSTLTLQVYVLDDAQTVIQTKTSILNTGRGSITTAGVLTINFLSTDSALASTSEEETHLALIEAEWDGGAKTFAHEVQWTVTNVAKRP